MPKNLGVWRGWKLGECLSGDMETSGWLFARVETSALCLCETSGSFRGYGNFGSGHLRVWKLGILAH